MFLGRLADALWNRPRQHRRFLGANVPSYSLLDARIDLVCMYKQMVQRPECTIELARPLFSAYVANEGLHLPVWNPIQLEP